MTLIKTVLGSYSNGIDKFGLLAEESPNRKKQYLKTMTTKIKKRYI